MDTIIKIKLNENEYHLLEKYAKENGISMNEAIKDSLFMMLENEYDIELFDKAYAKYKKDNKTYTSEEAVKELNIK